MYGKRAGLCRPQFAGGQRVRITSTSHNQVSPVLPDSLQLGRRGDFGNENSGRFLQLHGGESDRSAVIASRGCHHAGSRNLADQEIGKCAPGFERTRVLQGLQFENQRDVIETEVGPIDFNHRSSPDIRTDRLVGSGNTVTTD